MATQGRRRALGQHFLKDKTIACKIAETAVEETRNHDCLGLLEIGPGRGAITLPILDLLSDGRTQVKTLVLAERDQRLVEEWQAREVAFPIRVEPGDFMDLPEEKWLSPLPLAVVSNLPYSAGTAIVARLARHPGKIPVMVLMFQAEVAQRLRAEPGTKAWGSLSVWIQNRWDVTKLFGVPPGAFSPPPQVNSEVVILKARATPRIDVGTDPAQEALWEGLLKVCFAHRRKMLRSGLPPGRYRKALELSGLDGTSRAEALRYEDWEKLFRALQSVGSAD